jgi:hypothetical protein
LLPFFIFAQIRIADVKFYMIKAGIDFYATDTTVFKKSNMAVSDCITDDYSCLEQFCQSNELSGVGAKLKKWKEIQVNEPIQLKLLKDEIFKDITNAGKAYRTKLPAYEQFQKKMIELASSMGDSLIMENNTNTAVNNKAKLDMDESKITRNSSSANYLSWIALLTALLSLTAIIYSFTQKNQITTNDKQGSATNEVEKLEGKIAALREQFNLFSESANNKIEALDIRLEKNETWVNEKREEFKNGSNETANNFKTPSIEDSKKTEGKIYYALLPDLDYGFSDKILKNSQDGEQGYVITVKENAGTYEISGNEDAQAFAVNDFSFFLSRGCNLANQPFPKCKVKNLKQGTLFKTEAGWMIQEKAEIEFV